MEKADVLEMTVHYLRELKRREHQGIIRKNNVISLMIFIISLIHTYHKCFKNLYQLGVYNT